MSDDKLYTPTHGAIFGYDGVLGETFPDGVKRTCAIARYESDDGDVAYQVEIKTEWVPGQEPVVTNFSLSQAGIDMLVAVIVHFQDDVEQYKFLPEDARTIAELDEAGLLDEEYATYIMEHAGGDRVICDGDTLLQAQEDMYLHDEFIQDLEARCALGTWKYHG